MIFRAMLIALPFLVWAVWSSLARRGGKSVGPIPWVWLLAGGLILAAVSLLIAALIGSANPPDSTYIPVQSAPSGAVVPGPR